MHIALRSFLATAAAGLVLAPAALADTATKDVFLARDACGGSTPANTRLDVNLGASTTGCGSLAEPVTDSSTVYPAVAGAVPVNLDASRPVTVAISITSFLGTAIGGIGDETVSVALTGKNSLNKTVTLGTASETTPAATMLRLPKYTANFTLPLKPEQAGAYKGLTLTLTLSGDAGSGYVNHDGNSYVELPIPDADAPPAE